MPEISSYLNAYICVIVFLFGSSIASFVTCACDRYVAKQSVIKGRSKCPVCGHELKFFDLIPIFSYIFLRGKCRYCGSKIPIRCLITEFTGGLGYLLAVFKWGYSFPALEFAFLLPALQAVSLIDLDTMEIPNGLVLYITAVFAAFCFTYPDILGRVKDGVEGLLVYGGGILIISLITDKVLKRESLGGGDVKLFGALGLFLGLGKGLFAVITACIGGLIFGLAYKKTKETEQFPFGPAICFAAFTALAIGDEVVKLYLSLFGLA